MDYQTKNKLRSIALFLSITYALSSIFYFLIIDKGHLNIPLALGLMWSPGISAVITMKILKRILSELGWKWGKSKYQIQSFGIPILYTLAIYLIVWTLGWQKFLNDESVIQTIILNLIPAIVLALGEEIGWRGFLVPELYKNYDFTKTSLLSGFIWAVWHLPLVLFADYNSGTPMWCGVSCFMIGVMTISFVYTWLRIKSGSLWTAVFLHTSHNQFI